MTKQTLTSIPLVQAALRKTKGRYHRWKNDPVRHIGKVLDGEHGVNVVQIGSNDGSTGDPLHSLLMRNLSWKALFIEPISYLFERLKQNYPPNVRFCFENVAVSEVAGTSPFYYVDPAAKERVPNLPVWYDQIGSFDRNHISKHLGNELDPFIIKADIPTERLSTVLERNNISDLSPSAACPSTQTQIE
jgi:hypothetical protein